MGLKIPSSITRQNIGLRTSSGSHIGDGAAVYGWGSFGDFLDLREKVTFYLK